MNEKLVKARIGLIKRHPFFGTLAMYMKVMEDEKLNPPTACTDGLSIKFHPEFVKEHTLEQVRTVFVHELYHVVFKHHLRRGSRNPRKWNVACDYAINYLLVEQGFDRLPNWLYDRKFAKMTAEQIYNKLKDSDMPEEGDEGGWNFGGVEDQKTAEGGQVSEAQAKAIEAELNSRITQAAAVAKKAGLLPGGLETEIGGLLKPKVRWEDVLADFVDAYAKNDYSYAKLSRSAMQRGMVMPGLRSNELGHVLLIGDTSGSTYDCFNEFLTEMFGILDAYECEVTILAVDTSVYDVGNFRAGDFPEPKELKFKGGGGTSFEKITPYLHKHGIAPTVGVLFTDGYVCDWGTDPGFPMLIASNGSVSDMPKWANRVIKL